jgi:hypothetical protein
MNTGQSGLRSETKPAGRTTKRCLRNASRTAGSAIEYLSAGTGALPFFVDFPGECSQSPLPIEKCSAKPAAFGVVTNPNRIHSGVSLARWIDLTWLHSQYEDANLAMKFRNRTSTVQPRGPQGQHHYGGLVSPTLPDNPPRDSEERTTCVASPSECFPLFTRQPTERKRAFHQNMTGGSRHRIVDSPNLGFLGRGDRSIARTEVQEPNFREFRSACRDCQRRCPSDSGRRLLLCPGHGCLPKARNAQ